MYPSLLCKGARGAIRSCTQASYVVGAGGAIRSCTQASYVWPTELKAYGKEERMRELERRGEEREGRGRKRGSAWNWGELENLGIFESEGGRSEGKR